LNTSSLTWHSSSTQSLLKKALHVNYSAPN
jgi:hypothetical protein